MQYKDQDQFTGDWGIFSKPSRLSYQSELRIAIRTNCNDPIKLKFTGLGELVNGLVNQRECINKVIDGRAIIS